MTNTENNNYEFNIGDKVITTFGEFGEIIDICTCSNCIKRGWCEPVWKDSDGELHWITNWDLETGFNEYYQIGKYRFNSLFNKDYVSREIAHHERELVKWKKMRATIAEIEEVT